MYYNDFDKESSGVIMSRMLLSSFILFCVSKVGGAFNF